MDKIEQSGEFLGRFVGPLLNTGLSLMKNVLEPLAISVLIPLELTSAASAIDAAIHKKRFRLGRIPSDLTSRPSDLVSWTTTSIISNEEVNYITKIVKSLEESCLSIKGVSETIQNEVKEQKGQFLGMLLGTLGASLSGTLLTGKGTIRAGEGTVGRRWKF